MARSAWYLALLALTDCTEVNQSKLLNSNSQQPPTPAAITDPSDLQHKLKKFWELSLSFDTEGWSPDPTPDNPCSTAGLQDEEPWATFCQQPHELCKNADDFRHYTSWGGLGDWTQQYIDNRLQQMSNKTDPGRFDKTAVHQIFPFQLLGGATGGIGESAHDTIAENAFTVGLYRNSTQSDPFGKYGELAKPLKYKTVNWYSNGTWTTRDIYYQCRLRDAPFSRMFAEHGDRKGTFKYGIDESSADLKPGMVLMTDPASQKRYWMTILGGPVSCSGSYFGFQWQSSAIWTNLDRPFMSWSEHSATYGTTYNRKGGSVTFPKRWESYQTNLARHIGFNHHINDREQLVLGEYDWVHRNQSLSESGPSHRTYVVENPRLYGGNKPFFDFINLKKDTDYNRDMSKETTFTINSFSGFMGNEGGGTHHDRILGLHAAPPRIIVEDDSNNMYTWLKFKSYDGPFDMSDDPTEQHLTSKGDGNPAHLTVPMSDFRNQQCTSAAGCGATLEQSFFKLTMEYTTNQTLDVSHCYGHIYVPENKTLDQWSTKACIDPRGCTPVNNLWNPCVEDFKQEKLMGTSYEINSTTDTKIRWPRGGSWDHTTKTMTFSNDIYANANAYPYASITLNLPQEYNCSADKGWFQGGYLETNFPGSTQESMLEKGAFGGQVFPTPGRKRRGVYDDIGVMMLDAADDFEGFQSAAFAIQWSLLPADYFDESAFPDARDLHFAKYGAYEFLYGTAEGGAFGQKQNGYHDDSSFTAGLFVQCATNLDLNRYGYDTDERGDIQRDTSISVSKGVGCDYEIDIYVDCNPYLIVFVDANDLENYNPGWSIEHLADATALAGWQTGAGNSMSGWDGYFSVEELRAGNTTVPLVPMTAASYIIDGYITRGSNGEAWTVAPNTNQAPTP